MESSLPPDKILTGDLCEFVAGGKGEVMMIHIEAPNYGCFDTERCELGPELGELCEPIGSHNCLRLFTLLQRAS